MKKFVSVLLVIMILATSLSACGHKHTPGPAATCTEPQVCTECGEILVEATGHIPGPAATCSAPQTCTKCGEVLAPQLMHTPGADATCTEPQTCTVCGEILAEATGHDVGSDGVCTKCGTRIVPEGQKYIAPGKNGAVSDDTRYLPAVDVHLLTVDYYFKHVANRGDSSFLSDFDENQILTLNNIDKLNDEIYERLSKVSVDDFIADAIP